METLNTDSLSYNTYIKGTIGDIKSGLKIILYKHKPGLEKISITNLDEVLVEVLKENSNYGGYARLERLKDTDNYIYSKIDETSATLRDGFNTIIYLSSTNENIPVGYTEFLSTQGLIPNTVIISLNLTSKSENKGENVINIFNSFSSIREYSSLSKKLINNSLGGYVSLASLDKDLLESNTYPRYTSSVSNLVENSNTSILLDFGLCTSAGMFRLDLIKEMTLHEDFEHYLLGYYRNEIVLYAWKQAANGIEYFISSMSRKDKFGNPICYTNTPSRKKTLLIHGDGRTVKKINYFAGKYISVTLDTTNKVKTAVYNFETDHWVDLDKDNQNHIIDQWDPYYRITDLPNNFSRIRILDCIPEAKNLHLDIQTYPNTTIQPIKRVGDWFVFRETAHNLDSSNNAIKLNYLIYTNYSKTIRICEEYDLEPIPINNNLLLLRTKAINNGESRDYYTYFTADGDYCSENYMLARDTMAGVDSNYAKNYYPEFGCMLYAKKIPINGIPTWVPSTAENFKNYSNKNLVIDHISSDLLSSYIFGFRKMPCPEDLKMPEIIGSLNGMVYYKVGNKIKLL